MDRFEKKLRKKLEKAQNDGNFEEIFRVRSELSIKKQEAGNFDDAVDELKELLGDLSKDKNKLRVALAHRITGEALINTNDVTQAHQAEKHFKAYLALAEKEGDQIEMQRAEASIARYYFYESQLTDIESDKKKFLQLSYKANQKSLKLAIALEEADKISHKDAAEMKSRIYMNIALAFEIEGKIDEAEKSASKAVSVCRKNSCSYYDLAKCLKVFGVIKSKTSLAEGMKSINEALSLAEAISDSTGRDLQLEILEAKAEMLLGLGDFDQAKACLCAAYLVNSNESKEQITMHLKKVVFVLNTLEELKNMEEENYAERKRLFELLGDYSTDLKAYPKAVTYYKKMLEYSEKLDEDAKSRSAALVSIAISYADMRAFEKGIEYYERERELWAHSPKEECNSRINLANLCERRNDNAAQLEHLKHARALAVSSQNVQLQVDVIKLLLNYHKNYGDSQDQGIIEDLENEILNLRSNLGSQEEDSQPMDIEEVETVEAHESIDLDALPELKPKVSRESRTRRRPGSMMTKNEKGETPLHLNCIKGNLARVQSLVKNGHPVTVYDNSGWTPIHEAAHHGHAEVVKFLIENGANVNEQGKFDAKAVDGFTPLIDAASWGQVTVMELLLDMGAKVELKTTKRENAVNIFDEWYSRNKPGLTEDEIERCEAVRQRMVEALLKVGESVEAQSSAEPEFVIGTDDDQNRGNTAGTQPALVRSRLSRDSQDDNELRTMKRRKETQRILYSDDDYDDDDSARPSARRRGGASESDDDSPLLGRRGEKSHSSVSEYRNAVESVKRRNVPTQPRAPLKYNQQLSALVSEEIANQEWLVDDIGASTSRAGSFKRKLSSGTRSDSQHKRSKRKSLVSSSSSGASSPEIVPLETEQTFEREYHYVSPDSESSSEEDVGPKFIEKRLPRISPAKKSPAKRQRIITNPEKIKTSASPKKLFPADENISVRAKIQGKILLVPISGRNISLGTLAEKIAERYMKLEGMEPKLTLTTSDGAIMSPEDPISVILRPNETELEVCAIVESLILPPVSKRYKEACKADKIREDSHVLRCLEGSQATMELMLKNLPLGSQITPIFKCILKETSLQSINLSGCGIEDPGVEMLSTALSSLVNLQSLNLACNYVTSKGIIVLGDRVEQSNCLKALRVLDLSSNMLGEDGLKSLAHLLENLELTSLNISDCDLELPESYSDIPFLALDSIEDLNVSHNGLSCKGMSFIFGRLNAWNLKKLDISYNEGDENSGETSVSKELELLFLKVIASEEPGGVIKELNISGCDLEDQDLWGLTISASEKGIAIEHIKMSCNPKLTDMCLQPLMKHRPLITKITATGCPNLYDPSVVLAEHIKSLKVSCLGAEPQMYNGTILKGPGGYLQISQ
ncbi:tonsoku-like protein [Cloeon dipterum]|uniref:tonsoku-like protein n=1 Tax=Cloeon dipterum TaxID=197152 RepID=UPI0032200BDD